MNSRMVVAVISLGGVFLAAYLTLYHYGYVGSLSCGTGGCEVVQASSYAKFIGLPVALWGAGYYASVFLVSLLGSVGPAADKRWPTPVLLALNGWGVLFSAYLTWAEVARINALCRYCIASALMVVVLFGLSVLDHRARRPK